LPESKRRSGYFKEPGSATAFFIIESTSCYLLPAETMVKMDSAQYFAAEYPENAAEKALGV
jgi:hypothetical protein